MMDLIYNLNSQSELASAKSDALTMHQTNAVPTEMYNLPSFKQLTLKLGEFSPVNDSDADALSFNRY